MKSFPLYRQLDAMDCGATCLRMIAKHYGKSYSFDTLRQRKAETYFNIGMTYLKSGDEMQTISRVKQTARFGYWHAMKWLSDNSIE